MSTLYEEAIIIYTNHILSVVMAQGSYLPLLLLLQEYLKEAVSGSAQMIHTLCRDQEKRATCISTLSK